MCCPDSKKEKCLKPENLKGTPDGCTPEQVRACHGEVVGHPCVPGPADGCRKPENLAGKPGDCSPEQVRACHGEEPGHPCTPGKPAGG